jgi:hypothetical protein
MFAVPMQKLHGPAALEHWIKTGLTHKLVIAGAPPNRPNRKLVHSTGLHRRDLSESPRLPAQRPLCHAGISASIFCRIGPNDVHFRPLQGTARASAMLEQAITLARQSFDPILSMR